MFFRKFPVGLLLRKRRKSPMRSAAFSLLFYPVGSGQYLSCLIKCVGAKCTKRCYGV